MTDSLKVKDNLSKALQRNDFGKFSPRPVTSNVPFQKLVLEDPDAQGAVRIVVNALVKNGYHLKGSNPDRYERMLETKFRFRRFLRSAAWELSVFGNVFVELVGISQDGRGICSELNVVPTPMVEIIEDPTGRVVGYKVSNENSGVSEHFTPEQMVHIAWDRVGGENWGVSPFQSLTGILVAKRTLQQYINYLFETNQFRTHFNLEKASKEQRQDFVQSLDAAKRDPYKALVTQGTVNVSALRDYRDLAELRGILGYYSNEINLVNQVSPIQAGIVEGTNRSSGDVQVRFNFMNNIQAKQEAIEYEFTYDLLPRIGVPSTYDFKLNTADLKAELDLIGSAEKFYNMGADMQKVNDWLIDRGVVVPNELFPEREEVEEQPGVDERSIAQNSDSFPSRRGKDSMDRNEYKAEGAVDE